MSANAPSGPAFMHPTAREAIRRFVRPLAHDFNNLVTPLLAYPQLVRDELPEGAKSHALLDVIEKTAEDITRICRQLARLGYEAQTPSRQSVHLPIRKTVADLESEARSRDVALTFTIAADVPDVLIAESQLTGILHALVNNAIEAATDRLGGAVSVTASHYRCKTSRPVCGRDLPDGAYVRIDVRDNGCGIPPDMQANLFEPFVTSGQKRRLRGGGLELSIVYTMIADADGYIEFETAEGKGTLFSVYLHAYVPSDSVETPPAPAKRTAEITDADTGDVPRILVCDDEAVIVELFSMMLKNAFKTIEVDTAGNGQEAVECYKRRLHRVVLMDLHMPLMDGQTAFHEIESIAKAHESEPPTVIFCTGYAPSQSVQRITKTDSKHMLLLKPVGTQSLVEAVRAALHKR